MTSKLKFKIISCSSEEQQYPVSSLLFPGSEGWQSRRFCTYPQQITLQFYGVVNIRKIALVSDHKKICSQIDILYYQPNAKQERFYKYGYLQFSKNDLGNVREEKVIMVDINCVYLRFLFHKPYNMKENFFSQVGLYSLIVYGNQVGDITENFAQEVEEVDGEANEEDQAFVNNWLGKLEREKELAIQNEDFDSASYLKKLLSIVHDVHAKLKQNRRKINKAIEEEDYDTAKIIKQQIEENKREIQELLSDRKNESNGDNDMNREEEDNEFAVSKVEKVEQEGNQFMEDEKNESRVKKTVKVQHQNKANQSRVENKIQNSRVKENYEERVLPTLRTDRVKTENEEETKPKQLPPLEQIEGKFIKDATAMQQYFSEETTKKFFSNHWQYNLQALSSIMKDMKAKNKDLGILKILIFAIKFNSKQTNFQISQIVLTLLQETLKFNASNQLMMKPGELQNDLDEVAKEVFKKLTDNNPKIKLAAEQAFAQMITSSLYGVQSCCQSLIKSKSKLAGKQIGVRLILLTKMIEDYGLATGPNSVPLNVLSFGVQNLNNPAEDVRKLAVAMLNTAYKKDKAKALSKLQGVKESFLNQIKDENIVQKPKKK